MSKLHDGPGFDLSKSANRVLAETGDLDAAWKQRTRGFRGFRRPDLPLAKKAKGLLSLEDVVAHEGDAKKALDAKRREAAKVMDEEGSLPEWWDLRIPLKRDGRGKPPKFSCPEEFLSKGVAYLEKCFDEGKTPTSRGLCLWMGFHSWAAFNDYARRNVDFRHVHGQLLLALQTVIEQALAEGKGNPGGRKFLLSNINDGFEVDDPTDAPMKFSWKEKQQTELVGEGGGPIRIGKEIPPEEAYLRMLEGGRLERPAPEPLPEERDTMLPAEDDVACEDSVGDE